MASVMPAQSYPKIYKVNEVHVEVKNAAEDSAFQATPRWFSGLSALTYPKHLYIGEKAVKVSDSTQESGTRTFFAQG